MMGEEKRWRAFRVMETLRRLGRAVPDYGFENPRPTGVQFLKTEANMFSHIFCFLPRARFAVLKFTFSPFGYALLWLNSKKRTFRNWRRDTLASLKRRM